MANSDLVSEKDSSNSPSLSFQMVISGIQTLYPAVKNMSSSELEALMNTEETSVKLVIVDARPEMEFNVSHIPSAIRIDPQTQDMCLLKRTLQDQLNKGEPENSQDNKPLHVVMYCSVGYRSSALAKRLRQSVKKDKEEASNDPSSSIAPSLANMRIFNLEGCLFKWANEGRAMVDGHGNPTKFVHPYSVMWGQLVSRDIRKWEGPPT